MFVIINRKSNKIILFEEAFEKNHALLYCFRKSASLSENSLSVLSVSFSSFLAFAKAASNFWRHTLTSSPAWV